MTRFSVLGVTIGVFALVVVLSVMGGFEQNLRKRMFEGVSHIELVSPDNALAGFSITQDFKKDSLKHIKQLVNWTPFVRSDAVFIKKDRDVLQVNLLGLDPAPGGDVWKVSESLVMARTFSFNSLVEEQEASGQKLPGLILSENLAYKLKIKLGETVSLLNPQISSDQALGGAHASFSFVVAGFFRKSSSKFNKNFVLTSLKAARKFMPDYDSYLDQENYVTGIALRLTSPEQVDQVKIQLQSHSKLKLETWKETNKTIIFALKLEKYTMGAILLLVILVAAFSISGTLMMTVSHKRNQIAIFRSLGLSKKSVLQLHLLHGTMIGFVGAVVGLSIGLAFCFLIQSGLLQSTILSRRFLYLPVKFLYFDYLIISTSAVLLSLFAAVYPAMVAARRYPSEDLRSL